MYSQDWSGLCNAWLQYDVNPLNPHDASKHYFASLKTDF